MAIRTPHSMLLELSTVAARTDGMHGVRHLSHMSRTFANKCSVHETLARVDPLIYEYWEFANGRDASALNYGLTRITPGTIGREYHMTRGHFHLSHSDADEVYLVLQGAGLLLLQSSTGDSRVLEMRPQSMYLSPAGWAHRAVNCGQEDLLFFAVWPGLVEGDYESVERGGFPLLVVRGANGPDAVANPSFLDHESVIGQPKPGS